MLEIFHHLFDAFEQGSILLRIFLVQHVICLKILDSHSDQVVGWSKHLTRSQSFQSWLCLFLLYLLYLPLIYYFTFLDSTFLFCKMGIIIIIIIIMPVLSTSQQGSQGSSDYCHTLVPVPFLNHDLSLDPRRQKYATEQNQREEQREIEKDGTQRMHPAVVLNIMTPKDLFNFDIR